MHSEIIPLLADKTNPVSIARVSGISILFADLLCHVKVSSGFALPLLHVQVLKFFQLEGFTQLRCFIKVNKSLFHS